MKKSQLKQIIKEEIKKVLKEEKISQYGTHSNGRLYFQIGNDFYKIDHFSGGTAIRKAKQIPTGFRKQNKPDLQFANQIIKSIKNKKNDMGSWYSLSYS